MKEPKTIIITLGGSIIVPSVGKINVNFLKKFKKLLLKFLKKNYRFIIITGGGKTCRTYQAAAAKINNVSYEDQDWIGIHATRLNAQLLRTIFKKEAYPVILDNPQKQIKKGWKILIGSGWRPGSSTDYISVLLAKRLKIKEIIDAGNISFVYSKDPKKYKDAIPIKEISWKNYRKIIGPQRTPGLSVPIGPVAAKLSEQLKIRTIIIKGTDIKNFEKLLNNNKFKGTIIKT